MSFLTCPATAALSSRQLNVKHFSLMIVFLEILVFCCFHYSFEELGESPEYSPENRRSTEKMKAEMDEQIKAIEKAREEERVRLQQELSCVKQEVVDVTKVRIILDYRLQQF